MGRPAFTSFIVREEHSVLKFGMGRGVYQFRPLILIVKDCTVTIN
jgi:hypothetical protein